MSALFNIVQFVEPLLDASVVHIKITSPISACPLSLIYTFSHKLLLSLHQKKVIEKSSQKKHQILEAIRVQFTQI